MDFPSTQLNNGIINTLLYLPDPQSGFYRASRFDGAGIIYSLRYKDHDFFGPWYDHHNPFVHDSITGPVEEFSPIGFHLAKPGQNFLKPGVGLLKKDNEDSFNKFKTYHISDFGKRYMELSENEIIFRHNIVAGSFAYDYKKRITLKPGEPVMEISHALANSGDEILLTTVSNHNFFVIDGQITGPSFRLKFPFAVKFSDPSRKGEIPVIAGNMLEFSREVGERETVSPGFIKLPDTAEGFDVRLENVKSGAGVAIRGDVHLSAIYLWASRRTICPEPYIDINLQPGRSFNWDFRYEFYQL